MVNTYLYYDIHQLSLRLCEISNFCVQFVEELREALSEIQEVIKLEDAAYLMDVFGAER